MLAQRIARFTSLPSHLGNNVYQIWCVPLGGFLFLRSTFGIAIFQEEDRHKAELQQALGTSLALGVISRPNFITVGLNPSQPPPMGQSSGFILVGPGSSNTASTPIQGPSHNVASVAMTTTSGAVMRSLLPPISHKRDATSANINRALPVSLSPIVKLNVFN